MRSFARLLAVLCALPALAGDRAVSETFEVRLYPVHGATRAEVRDSILAARPSYQGRRFDALTLWNVKYHYWNQWKPEGCAPDAVRVELQLTLHFPDLENVSEVTRAAFTAYLAALRLHEERHAEIDRRIAEDLAAAIRAVPAQYSCEQLADEVKRAADRVIDQGRARNDAYDQDTDHGSAEGAVYPSG